jgi:hypothetical protein
LKEHFNNSENDEVFFGIAFFSKNKKNLEKHYSVIEKEHFFHSSRNRIVVKADTQICYLFENLKYKKIGHFKLFDVFP